MEVLQMCTLTDDTLEINDRRPFSGEARCAYLV
jgi:hypothetical protein